MYEIFVLSSFFYYLLQLHYQFRRKVHECAHFFFSTLINMNSIPQSVKLTLKNFKLQENFLNYIQDFMTVLKRLRRCTNHTSYMKFDLEQDKKVLCWQCTCSCYCLFRNFVGSYVMLRVHTRRTEKGTATLFAL